MNRWIVVLGICLMWGGCSSRSTTADLGGAVDAVTDQAEKKDTVEIKFKTDVVETRVAPEILAEVIDAVRPDILLLQCNPGEGCFLDKCTDNAQCQSGWCVEHMGDGVCTQVCQEECPQGWSCKQVGGDGPDITWVCISSYANLCKPCADSGDCKSVGAAEDVCVPYGDEGSFCGGACESDSDCPWGFSCLDGGEGISKQCEADAGICPCADKSVGLALSTPCANENEWGICVGERKCSEHGLTDCDASLPADETCNGVDDDCDGEADEPTLVDGNYINLCDDDNDCTEDKCTGEDGCGNEVLESGDCSNDDPCTVADHCVDGTCIGDPVECEDDNPCTDNACTETGGCEYPPNEDSCDDGNPCTLADTCLQGECKGTDVACDCLSDENCAELEDGDLCNGTLVCDTAQYPYKCVVSPDTVVICLDPVGDNAFCLQPHCEAATGECSFVPNHEGFLCDNADACAVNDKCAGGVCGGGGDVNCNDGNPCTDDSCAPESGCVYENNDLACNDGDVCTTQDQCVDGECPGGPALACSDGSVCNGIETCDPETGCVAGELLVCSDGNVCNGVETCDPAAGCQAGQALDCDDGNVCTDDTCDPVVGCAYSVNQTDCDDGNTCTDGDTCAGGWCMAGTLQDCDDTNECTKDSCAPATGCVNIPVQNGPLCGPGPPWECVEGACTCHPQCGGKECGADNCDGNCGECEANEVCNTGVCECVPEGAQCGAVCCEPGETCHQDSCCAPDCGGKECGFDGCGGSCGDCPGPQNACVNFKCICQPDCDGKECGPDGCEASCGECDDGNSCTVDACGGSWVCQHSLTRWQDQGDGTIWDCETGLLWSKAGSNNETTIYSTAVNYCSNLTTGGWIGWRVPELGELQVLLLDQKIDNCYIDKVFGGWCSEYWTSTLIVIGGNNYYRKAVDFYWHQINELDENGPHRPVRCVTLPCNPVCAGKACGDDGCGGSCGLCSPGNSCTGGQCVKD